MADTAAFYGLVGALGGALLGAGAAIAAPLLQNRSAARARRWALAEAEVNRLIKLRGSTRAVLHLQGHTVEALAAGREVAADDYAVAMSAAFSELQEAADGALMDGLVLPVSGPGGYSPTPYGWSPPATRRRNGVSTRPAENTVTSPIVVALQRLDDDIRAALESSRGAGVPPETISGLREQVAQAERLRGELISKLLDRMETARSRTGAN